MGERRESGGSTRRRFLIGAAASAGVLGAATHATALRGVLGVAVGDEPAERLTKPPRVRWRPTTIGQSVEGRPITMYSNFAPDPRVKVMVVSTIHGNEPGAPVIGHELTRVGMPADINAYVIPVANPDGLARGSRFNANGVDLNRNFSWGWLPFDGGPAPRSEPETSLVSNIIELIRPDLTIWVHQPLEYVAPITSGAWRLASVWARECGLRVRADVEQHGGGETWCARELGVESILVEATPDTTDLELAANHRRGFEALLAEL